jgi:hypothetical protein
MARLAPSTKRAQAGKSLSLEHFGIGFVNEPILAAPALSPTRAFTLLPHPTRHQGGPKQACCISSVVDK